MIVRSRSLGLALVFAMLTGFAFAQSAGSQPGADFLALVDAKRYAESWDAASDYFKQSVSKSDWSQQVAQARSTLGTVASRRLKSSEPQKNPPGAPQGDYLLVTYETKFTASEPARTETLPLIKAADGRWRAVGYFVR